MSVINDVLTQLEQRGAAMPGVATSLHPVYAARSVDTQKWLWASVAVVLLAAVWTWRHIAPISATQPVPLLAANEIENRAMPASRFSFELSSVPNPNIQRVKNNTTTGAPIASPIATQEVVKNLATVPTFNNANQPIKHISIAQQADAEFRKAVQLMQQGRVADAMAGYETALHLDATHIAARQALVALLLESKRAAEAEKILQDGINKLPAQTGFAMLLARLQVEKSELDSAIVTLETSLPYAEQQADFHAFYAALLQRKNRHQEAVTQYQVALQAMPNKAIWLMGYAISLQALARPNEAKSAYEHALATQTLSAELQAFVQGKIKGL